jgi:transposase
MASKRVRRKSKRVPGGEQRGFAFGGEVGPRPPPAPGEVRAEFLAEFHDPDPARLRIGEMPLEEYLRQHECDWVIGLRLFVRALDPSALLKVHKGPGRKPFHPAPMLGLILFGLIIGVDSLRGMAQLAATDVRAWWITGGLQPDFTTLCKFINARADLLSEEFFTATTRQMITMLGVKPGPAAGDGTVIDAAASHWRTLKAEAASEAAKKAVEAAAAAPNDASLAAKADQAKRLEEVAAERMKRAKEASHSTSSVRVAPTEPDAVVQPGKSGAIRPSYKPSVLANPDRLIVGQTVIGSDEVAAIPLMLEQHRDLFGVYPTTTLLDANYHSIRMLSFFVEKDLDVLCPSGTARGTSDFRTGSDKPLSKTNFTFDETHDRYLCPEGRPLERHSRGQETHGQEFTRYRGKLCTGCPRLAECTKSSARTIKRYDGEELKEAADQVLEHPAARDEYRRRREMVEPVFAGFKGPMQFSRFRRRGLKRVRLEFSLRCVAYNLKRALGIQRLLVAVLFVRSHQARWRPVALIVVLT